MVEMVRMRQGSWSSFWGSLAVVTSLLFGIGRTTQAQELGWQGSGSVVHLDEHGKAVIPRATLPPPIVPEADGGGAEVPASRIQQAPGGGEMIILGDRFRSRSIGRCNANGRVKVRCTEGDTHGHERGR